MKQFAEIQSEIVTEFVKSKKLIIVSRSVLTSQRPLVIEDLSTATYTFQLDFNRLA